VKTENKTKCKPTQSVGDIHKKTRSDIYINTNNNSINYAVVGYSTD